MFRKFLCGESKEDGRYDRLATLLFGTQSNTIKNFMTERRDIMMKNAGILGLIWFVFLTISNGMSIPMGIFMPCIIIGCSVGQIYFELHL
jgi:Voltage gated chloride channel